MSEMGAGRREDPALDPDVDREDLNQDSADADSVAEAVGTGEIVGAPGRQQVDADGVPVGRSDAEADAIRSGADPGEVGRTDSP